MQQTLKLEPAEPKPCPFCGGRARIVGCAIGCAACGIGFGAPLTVDRQIGRLPWNERVAALLARNLVKWNRRTAAAEQTGHDAATMECGA